jgi:hypothetical protein
MATEGAAFFRQQDGKLSCVQPGQAFSELDGGNVLDEHGHPSSEKDATVDFAIFSDGSTWGPGADLEQKGYLRGTFDAYKQMQIQKNNSLRDSVSNFVRNRSSASVRNPDRHGQELIVIDRNADRHVPEYATWVF